MLKKSLLEFGGRTLGGAVALAGVILMVLAPAIGGNVFGSLWGVEPLAYIGAVLLLAGLAFTTLSYVIPAAVARRAAGRAPESNEVEKWGHVTQQYFELFDHDLGRPLRRIAGKERELRAVLRASGEAVSPAVKDLLDEIEMQTPNFRLMLSNIQVLVQLESPEEATRPQPVEPSELIRRIVGRYSSLAAEANKEITWWSEPPEFGIVYSEGAAIEHIVTNLVDNAVRFAASQVEVKLTKNPSHFFIRVWDDGPGVAPQYTPHIFDRGWTPEVARREEKSSSGLGLFIARTLAQRAGGELTVESVTAPAPDHHTALLLGLPLNSP
jgi:signal transduction histidine kinase